MRRRRGGCPAPWGLRGLRGQGVGDYRDAPLGGDRAQGPRHPGAWSVSWPCPTAWTCRETVLQFLTGWEGVQSWRFAVRMPSNRARSSGVRKSRSAGSISTAQGVASAVVGPCAGLWSPQPRSPVWWWGTPSPAGLGQTGPPAEDGSGTGPTLAHRRCLSSARTCRLRRYQRPSPFSSTASAAALRCAWTFRAAAVASNIATSRAASSFEILGAAPSAPDTERRSP